MIPKLIFQLASEVRKLVYYFLKVLFSDGEASQLTNSFVVKMKSHVVTYLEATNDGKHSKSPSKELLVIDFITNFVKTTLHKKNFKTAIHFISNHLTRLINSNFQLIQQTYHKITVTRASKSKKRVFNAFFW